MPLLHAGSSLWSPRLLVSDVLQLVSGRRWKLQALAQQSINSVLSRSCDTGDYKLGWIKHTFWISHKILAVRGIQRLFRRERAREENGNHAKEMGKDMGLANPACRTFSSLPFPCRPGCFYIHLPNNNGSWDFSLCVYHWNIVKSHL